MQLVTDRRVEPFWRAIRINFYFGDVLRTITRSERTKERTSQSTRVRRLKCEKPRWKVAWIL